MVLHVEVSAEIVAQAERMAQKQNISTEAVLGQAISDWFRVQQRSDQRATAEHRKVFFDVMSRVPDVEPDEQDRISPDLAKKIRLMIDRS